MDEKQDPGAPPIIDGKRFWRTLGERAIGVTVVTAADKNGPAGFLALSAAHVAADPPTMLCSIDRKTTAINAVLESKHFAVNILAREHEALSDAFGSRDPAKHATRFVAGDWTTLRTGAPILKAALGAFDCELDQVVDRGGVIVAIGRVVDCLAKGDGDPLIFFRGKYR